MFIERQTRSFSFRGLKTNIVAAEICITKTMSSLIICPLKLSASSDPKDINIILQELIIYLRLCSVHTG